MSLVSGYKTLSEILPVVAVKIGAVKTAQDLENMSTLQGIGLTLKKAIALGVETVALKLKAVWQAIVNLLTGDFTALGVAAVAAVVALAGAMVYGLVKLEEYCSTEAKLNREVERTTEVAEKAREAYQKIQDTFNNYQSAQDKLKGLEEGTVEFYNALIEANERAMELIDTLDLIAGEDYAVDPNGLIQINEEALEDAMYDKQREVFRTQGVKANAKYNLASYERDQIVSEFRNAANDKSRFGVGMDYTTAENVLSKNLDEEEINGEYVSRANLSGMNDVATSLDQMNDKLGGVGTAIVSGLVGPINLIGGTVAHEMITQGFKDGVTDITEEVGQFRGEYNAKTAEMLALERQIADSYIRAYGDKKSLEIYNKANSKQKQLMQDYTTQKRQEQQIKNQQNTKNKGGWNSFWDTSDNGFWGSLGINLLGGVLNGITGGIHGGQQIYSQVTSISDMELKEQYAKNVLGYTQDDKGQ